MASERGETQLGIILLVLLFGGACWLLTTMQGCFVGHKQAKAKKNHDADEERRRRRRRVHREVGGYTVSVK